MNLLIKFLKIDNSILSLCNQLCNNLVCAQFLFLILLAALSDSINSLIFCDKLCTSIASEQRTCLIINLFSPLIRSLTTVINNGILVQEKLNKSVKWPTFPSNFHSFSPEGTKQKKKKKIRKSVVLFNILSCFMKNLN